MRQFLPTSKNSIRQGGPETFALRGQAGFVKEEAEEVAK